MARVTMPVNKDVLQWAREMMGYDIGEVAGKLPVKPEKVVGWEKGITEPTLRQLEKLSDLYKQPLITFFHDKLPEEPKWPKDYRTFHGGHSRPLLPKTKTAIWEAQWRQSVAAELRQEMGIEFQTSLPELKLSSDPEKAAQRLRESIGPDISTQAEWAKEPRQLLKKWREVLEEVGILTFRLDFPREDARGFSLPDPTAPVIVVSAKDSLNAEIFSLFHELAHLLMHESGACNDLEFRTSPKNNNERVEALSNRFAGAYLVPQDALLNNKTIKAHKGKQWNNDQLSEIAYVFGVSREVILRRLVILEKVDIVFYRKWRKKQKDEWKDFAKKGGFAVPRGYARKIINKQGKSYVGTILDAYTERIINLSETSEYLGVKTKHIGDIEYVLSAGESK